MAMPPLILAAFILGYFLRGSIAPYPQLGDKVREAAGVVRDRYYGDVTDEKLERAALEGMMNALDPYCQYFTRKDYEEFYTRNISGNFYGVGILVEVDRETGYLNIITPLEGTPAFAADILPGDKLLKVNGEDIKGQQLDDVIRKIKGPEGSPVQLTLWRKSKNGTFELTLKRAMITIVAVKSKMIEAGHKIGYVRVSDFTEMLPQFDKATAELMTQGMDALVVDLRFNGGGLLDSAVELADRFLPAGKLIVTTRGRHVEDHREAVDDSHDIANVPVVILTNEGTASASEVFAGALRDHGRAVIVGARTFGKGSVQTPVPLSDGSRLKITTARYFTPKGVSVHREEGKKEYGILPDYVVEMTEKEYVAVRDFWREESVVKAGADRQVAPPKDFQLEAAIEVLSAKLEQRDALVKTRELSAAEKPGDETPK